MLKRLGQHHGLTVEQFTLSIVIGVLNLMIEFTLDQESKEAMLDGEYMKKKI